MEKIRDIIDKIGGRKLVISLLIFITATGILFADVGNVDFDKWADLVKWTFMIYAAGNVGSKVSNRKKTE